MAKIRVAVIGAGGAGLSMCKCLADEPQVDFVAFEKSDKIGGLWRYSKDDPERECHTAMYKNLRTNIAKEIMAFPEFPFPENLSSFVKSEVVVKYLEDYVDHFGFGKNIKFQHEVISVKPDKNREQTTWNVVAKDLKNDEIKTGVFDAVVVCNGHYSVPNIPEIPGMAEFPGTIIHSIDYNEPTVFNDQRVLVLGAATSGLDVCLQVSVYAKKLHLVHRGKRINAKFAENVEEIIGTLTRVFSDGSVEINHECRRNVDVVIFCTGYSYSFPFLDPECQIKVENNRVTSLYKHVFNTHYTSLSFVGLCISMTPFPHFGIQAQWITSILTGRKKLPSREEMIEDEEADYQEKLFAGLPLHGMHTLGPERHESYHNELAKLAGVARLPAAIHSLFLHMIELRSNYLTTYKSRNFHLSGDDWYEI